jgi:hypothetical protein
VYLVIDGSHYSFGLLQNLEPKLVEDSLSLSHILSELDTRVRRKFCLIRN